MLAVVVNGCAQPRPDAYDRHRITDARHGHAQAVIEASNGSVLQENPGSNVIVDLRKLDAKQASAALAGVNDLFQVHTLTVIGPLREDVSLTQLQSLPSLAVLILEDMRLTPADWQAVKRQPALASLTLTDTGLSDANINELLQLKGIRRLTLVNQPLTEAGVLRLGQMDSLRRVRLVNAGGSVEAGRQLVDVNPYLIVDVQGQKVRGIDATE